MITRRILMMFALALFVASTASAQTAASYVVNYYNAGATSPVQTENFPATAAVCNQAAVVGASTVNPTRIVFDDVANPGKVCIFSEAASGPLFSVPIGSYEGTLSAVNAAGTTAESVRGPFSRLALAPVPTNVKVVR